MERSSSISSFKETASSFRARQYLYNRISKAGAISNFHFRSGKNVGSENHLKARSYQVNDVMIAITQRPMGSIDIANTERVAGVEKSKQADKKKRKPGEVIKTNMKYLNDFEKREMTRFRFIYYFRQKLIDYNEKTFEKEGDYLVILGDAICYRYEIKEIINSGSFGQVLMCRDHKNNENVAIKVLKKHVHSNRIGVNEYEIVELLNKNSDCCNIIKAKKKFTFRNHFFMVFELLGMSLFDFMYKNNSSSVNLNLIKRITFQVLRALQDIHACNIIHCDIKPENIAFKNNNKSGIKVIDFGTSTNANKILFCYFQTRNYRAPEVVFQIKNYDFAIDIWSLGCVVCEMILGTPLFNSQNETELVEAMCFLLGPPPKELICKATENVSSRVEDWKDEGKIRSVLHGIPNEVVDFIECCLKWEPGDRKTAKECLQFSWFQTSRSRSNSYEDLMRNS